MQGTYLFQLFLKGSESKSLSRGLGYGGLGYGFVLKIGNPTHGFRFFLGFPLKQQPKRFSQRRHTHGWFLEAGCSFDLLVLAMIQYSQTDVELGGTPQMAGLSLVSRKNDPKSALIPFGFP